MNKKPIHSAISTVLCTLHKTKGWLELEANATEPMERMLYIPTVIADLRGAARYVLATEGDHTAAALLMMAAVYLKQLHQSTAFPGFALEMMTDLDELIHGYTELEAEWPPRQIIRSLGIGDEDESEDADDSLIASDGLCPVCGTHDGRYMNLGPEHILFCEDCKTAWHGGSNLYATWRDEDFATWKHNEEELKEYRIVNPVHRRKDAERPRQKGGKQ